MAGFGGTMLIGVALSVITRRLLEECSDLCPDHIDVFVQKPYYSGYVDILKEVHNAKWNPEADPNSPWTIEILT